MRLDQQPQLRQGQRLVMTPQLRQAVEILQYSSLELAAFLQEQTLQNPLLELDSLVLDREDGDDLAPETTPEEEDVAEGALDPTDLERWLDYFPDSSDLGLAGPGASVEMPDLVEMAPAAGPDLADHLRLQISMGAVHPVLLAPADALVEALDADGYLRISLADLGAATGIPEDLLGEALAAVQRLDPPGVAARDLRECLLLQLQAREPSPAVAWAIELVDRHLPDVGSSRTRHLAAVTGL